MDNILTSNYRFMNRHTINYHEYNNCNIKVSFKSDINSSDYFSFGIHFTPNILFKTYNSLNNFLFKIKFDFKLINSENFSIYNGIEWVSIQNNLKTGKIIQSLNFDFKKYWRIRPSKCIDFEISNITIHIDENCEKFLEFKKKKKNIVNWW